MTADRARGRRYFFIPGSLPGLKVHEAVLKAGEKENKCTVHYVDSGIDTGELIMSMKVPVLEGDTPEILQKRVLEKEHLLLVKGLEKILED